MIINFIKVVKKMTHYTFLGFVLQVLIASILFASAPAEGQNLKDVKLSLTVRDASLKSVFKEITDKTEFTFSYRPDEILLDQKVSLNMMNSSLYDVLKTLSEECQLNFERVNNQIVVKKPETKIVEQITVLETGSIAGKVIDEDTKDPLIGANIMLKETTYGTTTNVNGYYSLPVVEAGKYTIVVRFVGYTSIEEVITVQANKIIELNFALIPSTYTLDEVTVTGSISERSLRESSNPITVITPKELQNRNLNNLSGVLSQVSSILPGQEAAQQNPFAYSSRAEGPLWSSLNLRGFTSTYQSGTKFLLDGVEVTGGVLNTLDPNQIEKIEVAIGPMSTTLYGSGAANGIVQIFRKKGFGDFRLNFKTTLESKESIIQVANPLIQTYALNAIGGDRYFGYNLGLNYYHSKTSRWAASNAINENDWTISAGLNGIYKDFELDLKLNYSNNSYASIVSATVDELLLKHFGYTILPQYVFTPLDFNLPVTSDIIQVSLNLQHKITDELKQKLVVGTGISNSLVTNKIYNQNYKGYSNSYGDSKTFSANYNLNYKKPLWELFTMEATGGFSYSNYKSMRLIFGTSAAFNENTQLLTGYGALKGNQNSNRSSNQTMGLFGEAVLGYENNLFLTLGYRAENNNTVGQDIGWLSIPRVGLTYVAEFDEITIKPRISWGKSTAPLTPYYKEESLTETVIGGGSYRFIFLNLGNPNLQPEEQSGYEIGGDFFLGNDISFSVTYFNQHLKNIVEQNVISVVDSATFTKTTTQYVNLSGARNTGVELKGRVLFDPFAFLLTYTYCKSVYADGAPEKPANASPEEYYFKDSPVYDVPKNTFFAQVAYRLPEFLTLFGGSITLEYKYVGESLNRDFWTYTINTMTKTPPDYTINYITAPGWGIFNLRFNYSIIKNLSLFCDISNLTNFQEIIKGQTPPQGRSITFGLNTNL